MSGLAVLCILFVLCLLAPVYTYALYPLLLKLLPSKKYDSSENALPAVTVVLSAYNEKKHILARLENLAETDYPKDRIEFLIGSDGSTDGTDEIAKTFCAETDGFTFMPLRRGGKVSVLNALLKRAKGEILVFADASRFYKRDAVKKIVRKFADKRIGCVNGLVRLELADDAGSGGKSESAYWRYETWVKRQESRIGRLSGANGPLYAIRAGILDEIKPGIINDDFYVATYIMQKGYDEVMDEEAVAYGNPNDSMGSQFKRHIRDGAGHYQALAVFWRMLLPRKGSFVYWSHRVMKWLVPFNLITAFVCSAVLSFYARPMLTLFIIQLLTYLLLTLYYFFVAKNNRAGGGILSKSISLIFYFFTVNLALLLGFIRLINGKQKAVWETQR